MTDKKLIVSLELEYVGDENLVHLISDLVNEKKDTSLTKDRSVWDYEPEQHVISASVVEA